MYCIQYAPVAQKDLGRIKTYLISEFGGKVAKRVLTDYRYLVTKKNYAFYRTEPEVVKVIRVLNERQDFMRILFGIVEVEDDDWNN